MLLGSASEMRRTSFIAGFVFTVIGASVAPAAMAPEPDGRYEGRMKGSETKVSLKIDNDGRRVRGFKTVTTATCINPNSIGGLEVVALPVVVDSIKVKRNGRFEDRTDRRYETGDRFVTVVSGVLDGERITDGAVELERTCEGSDTFTAKRR